MKNIIIVISITILFVVWFKFSDSDENNNWHVETKAHSITTTSSAPTTIINHATTQAAVSANQESSRFSAQVQTKSYDGWDSRLPDDSKNWMRSKGYFSDVDLHEYKGFKLDQLELLANQGDLKAIEVLSQYELSSGNSERYRELVDLSVASGSLSGITILTANKLADYSSRGRRKEADILEAFAYQTFAFRRGDLNANYQLYAKSYNFYPNEEQQQYIDKRADELMADFEKRRKALGLPPFDNAPLESDKRNYELVEKYKKEQESGER